MAFDQSNTSKLKLYSMAIVLEDKPRETNKITCTPIELLSHVDGLLIEEEEKYKTIKIDANDVIIKGKSLSNVIMEATWIPYTDPNRATSPMVCANETVSVWKFSDTEEYYWSTVLYEPVIRKNEHFKIVLSNTPTPLTELNDDNTYWEEWDTIEKRIHLHTSDNDGEAAKYDRVYDTKEGTWHLWDNHSNNIQLFSPERRIWIHTRHVDYDIESWNLGSGNGERRYEIGNEYGILKTVDVITEERIGEKRDTTITDTVDKGDTSVKDIRQMEVKGTIRDTAVTNMTVTGETRDMEVTKMSIKGEEQTTEVTNINTKAELQTTDINQWSATIPLTDIKGDVVRSGNSTLTGDLNVGGSLIIDGTPLSTTNDDFETRLSALENS